MAQADDPRLVSLVFELFLLVLDDHVVFGVDDHFPGVAVHDQEGAVLDPLGRGFQPHHRRYLQGLRNDGRMGGSSADIGDEPHHLADVDRARVGRRELVGHDDDPLAEVEDVLLPPAGQIPEDPLRHVLHVIDALPEVFVVDLTEELPDVLDRLHEGPFGIDLLLQDGIDRRIQEHGVFHDHQMRVQNERMLLDLFRHPLLVGDDLLFCRVEGLLEPLRLLCDRLIADQVLVKDLDPGSVHQPRLPDDDAGRDGYASQFHFCLKLFLGHSIHQISAQKDRS